MFVIFGINTTSDISKFFMRNFLRRVKFGQFWNITSGIDAKYHVEIMLLFVYTTTIKRFVIFTFRYFRLSWNTTALSQSNCRHFSCSSITWVLNQRYVILINGLTKIKSSQNKLQIRWTNTRQWNTAPPLGIFPLWWPHVCILYENKGNFWRKKNQPLSFSLSAIFRKPVVRAGCSALS